MALWKLAETDRQGLQHRDSALPWAACSWRERGPDLPGGVRTALLTEPLPHGAAGAPSTGVPRCRGAGRGLGRERRWGRAQSRTWRQCGSEMTGQETAQGSGGDPQTDRGTACPPVTRFSLPWHPQRCAVCWLRQQAFARRDSGPGPAPSVVRAERVLTGPPLSPSVKWSDHGPSCMMLPREGPLGPSLWDAY